jgi:hypothetical protein
MSWISDDEIGQDDDIPLDFLSDDADDHDAISGAQHTGSTSSILANSSGEPTVVAKGNTEQSISTDSASSSAATWNSNRRVTARRHTIEPPSVTQAETSSRRRASTGRANAPIRRASGSNLVFKPKPIGTRTSRQNSTSSVISNAESHASEIVDRRDSESSTTDSLLASTPAAQRGQRSSSDVSVTSQASLPSRRRSNSSTHSTDSLNANPTTKGKQSRQSTLEGDYEVDTREEDSGLPDHLQVLCPHVSIALGPNKRSDQRTTRHDAEKYENYHRRIDSALQTTFSTKLKRSKSETSQLGAFEIVLSLKGLDYVVFSKLKEKKFPNPRNVVGRIRSLLGWEIRKKRVSVCVACLMLREHSLNVQSSSSDQVETNMQPMVPFL